LTDICQALRVQDAPKYPGDRQVLRFSFRVAFERALFVVGILESNSKADLLGRFDIIWTLTAPYTKIDSWTSEHCPGLDDAYANYP
jgi:hypothetical protein